MGLDKNFSKVPEGSRSKAQGVRGHPATESSGRNPIVVMWELLQPAPSAVAANYVITVN